MRLVIVSNTNSHICTYLSIFKFWKII